MPSVGNLKPVAAFRWHRLRGDRVVSPEDRAARKLDDVAVSAEGTVLHLRGFGMVKVFRIDAPDGDAESWATNDLGIDEGMRRHDAGLNFAIENYHRELKPNCGAERCQAGPSRAQRNPIGLPKPSTA